MADPVDTMRSWDQELARGGRLVFSVRTLKLRLLLLAAVAFGVVGVLLLVSGETGVGLLALILGGGGGVVFWRQFHLTEPLIITNEGIRRQLWVGSATSFPWAAVRGAESSFLAGGILTLLVDSQFLAGRFQDREGRYWRWARRQYARRQTSKIIVAQGLAFDPGLLAFWINERVNTP